MLLEINLFSHDTTNDHKCYYSDKKKARLNARRGDLRARPDGERDLRLLAVVHREALQKQAAETRTRASTTGVEHHEALEARAVVGELAETVQDQIHDLLSNSVVTC